MRPFYFAIALALGLPQTAAANDFAMPGFTPEPGTYTTHTVSSAEDCSAICQSDNKCRGMQAYQPDITQSVMYCFLNDGLSPGSSFTIKAPPPLNLEKAVSDLNSYRARYGLGPVKLNTRLNDASEVHAKDLAEHGIASHTGSDGSSHSDRVQREGYYFSIAAENVATGQKSWEKVFKAWQDSPGHNENLLLPEVTDFGVALVHEPTTTYANYWAMLVAAPLSSYSN